MTTSVVLLSGGLDSAVALAGEITAGHLCVPVFVGYGQRHERAEGTAARAVARHYLLDLREVSVQPGLSGSSLTGGAGELTGAATVVPARNLILCALAASVAVSIGAGRIVIGCNRNDWAVYPDCRPEFFGALNEVLRGDGVRVWTPLIHRSKAEVAAEGQRLQVPIALTWSCYTGGDVPCGTCGACAERQAALTSGGTPS